MRGVDSGVVGRVPWDVEPRSGWKVPRGASEDRRVGVHAVGVQGTQGGRVAETPERRRRGARVGAGSLQGVALEALRRGEDRVGAPEGRVGCFSVRPGTGGSGGLGGGLLRPSLSCAPGVGESRVAPQGPGGTPLFRRGVDGASSSTPTPWVLDAEPGPPPGPFWSAPR